MPSEFLDFRLTQDAPNAQLLTLARDPTYPSYHIKTHESGDKYLLSLLSHKPDVSISHRNYLAPAFAKATFRKYRNSISIIYPETSLRTPDGDVTTTVQDILPLTKQDIKCEDLGERQFSLELDLGCQWRERCSWHPPRKSSDSSHILELKREVEQREEEEALAKILLKSWGTVAEDELIAVVRVRRDLMGEEDSAKGADQVLVTATVLVERLRRRHWFFTDGSGATISRW